MTVQDTAVQLPVIDPSQRTPDTGATLLNAAIKYGFLFIKGDSSGFSSDLIHRTFETVRVVLVGIVTVLIQV